MKNVNMLAAGLLLLGQSLCGTALAVPVTLVGNNVNFSFDDAMLGLFGQARVSGDTLYFTPVDFVAKSLNGVGFSLANETVNIAVSAHANRTFKSIGFKERGDYLLLGAGGSVEVAGQMRVFDVAKPLVDITSSLSSAAALTQSGLPTRDWAAGASIDLAGLQGARTINVTLENLLLASTSNPGTLAFIEKKFVGLAPTVMPSLVTNISPVPEANTYAMLLAGLGLIGLAYAKSHRTK